MQNQESTKSMCARFSEELEAGNKPEINAYLKLVASAHRSKLNEALQDVKVKYALRQARKELDENKGGDPNAFPSISFNDTTPDIAEDDFSLNQESSAEQEVITPGQQIGRYKLLRILGAGGMGAVWLAEQFEPVHRRVALKLVRADATSTNAVPRFEAERQAVAMMDHPNIAKIYDAGTTAAGNPFLSWSLSKGFR